MDHRSWSWRRKSSDKNPGEAESSGSMSSHSELYSDDQEVSRASSNLSTQSPEVTSKIAVTNEEVNDKLKSLREKLSAALINISVKDDLVKQHAKVAEEAVSGWEKAGNEAAILKQQLEAAVQKNFALEDRIGHLDGALKECLRKLRQTREEQERKIHEAVLQNTRECDSMKFELEKKLVQLQAHVETAKVEDGTPTHSDLLLKLETAEKQNSALERELLAQVEELEMMALERDLSTETAEIASKQHLESIRKVTKLEAECRKLRAMAHKTSLSNDHKSVTSTSVYVESHTDSQSDIGERLLTLDTDNHKLSGLELSGCEPSRSDSWASALIAELDQFKNQKAISKNFATSSVENDFMDDFLEMERLAALPQLEGGKHGTERGFSSDRHSCQGCQHKADLDAMMERMTELENKLEKVEVEKASLEVTLAESQGQLKTSQNKLTKAKDKLMELHRQLDLANYSKQETEAEMKMVFAKRELVKSQLASMDAEVLKLHAKVGSLEAEVKQERALSAQITTKCRELEDELSTKKREAELLQAATSNIESKLKQERELAVAAGKFAECQKTIASLGRQLKSLATSDDFLVDSKHPLKLNEGSLISRTDELLNSSSYNRETIVQI